MKTAPKPWYLEPWTWMLVGLPAIAVLGSLSSAILAFDGADPIIEDNYYQRGLDINSTLARVQNAAALGLHASVEYDGLLPGETVWVRVHAAQPLHDASLQIRLIHPARSGLDRTAVLARVPRTEDTEAEFTGQWPGEAVAGGRDPAGAHAGALNWRIALQGQNWQVEGDLQGRNDLAAR